MSGDPAAPHPARDADAPALGRMLQVEPALVSVRPAADALDLRGRCVLHAGPPISQVRSMARPQLNSVVMAVLFERWAEDERDAEAMVLSGAVELIAAQDRRAVVPLADMLSPSMQVLEIADAREPARTAFSTINGGDGPVLRVGQRSTAAVERLRWINGEFAGSLQHLLQRSGPIALLPMALAAAAQGDDCHGRTVVASRLLAERLLGGAGDVPEPVRDFLGASAAFFLNPWMAASQCIMSSASGLPGCSVVTAIGGNGVHFGIQVGGLPGRWFTADGAAPVVPGADAAVARQALNAIGDSAVVDALGFGAMGRAFAPATAQRLQQVLDESGRRFPQELLDVAHPAASDAVPLALGLRARRVREQGAGPIVSLGVLDRDGVRGRLDGGFFFTPVAPFLDACAQLEAAGEASQ